MTSLRSLVGALVLTTAVVPAHAQPRAGAPAPPLHVSAAHDSCFFDLHPELTAAEFEDFADELGSILRFRQLGENAPLGKGRFELSLQYARSPIDDAKGAWNNTMSHPTADHGLGGSIAFPRIAARYGLSDRMDLGAWGSLNPRSNYGILGVDTRIALLKQGPSRPVTLTIRPSVTTLVGPSELWAGNASVDVSVSRAFGRVSPYVGVSTYTSGAVERSKDVDLDPASTAGSLAYAGVSVRLRGLTLAGEVGTGPVRSVGFSVASRFGLRPTGDAPRAAR